MLYHCVEQGQRQSRVRENVVVRAEDPPVGLRGPHKDLMHKAAVKLECRLKKRFDPAPARSLPWCCAPSPVNTPGPSDTCTYTRSDDLQPMEVDAAPTAQAQVAASSPKAAGAPEDSAGPEVPQTPFDGAVASAEAAAEPVARPPFIDVPPEVEALMATHLDFLRRQGGGQGTKPQSRFQQ